MDRNNSSFSLRFNPRRYEDHLSVFGKKVLNAMIQKWKTDRNRVQKSQQQRFDSPVQNRRVITFRDKENFRPSLPLVCNQIAIENELRDKPFDFNLEKNLSHVPINRPQPIPTSLHLVQAVDTGTCNQNISSDHTNISSHDLINPISELTVDDLCDKLPGNDLFNDKFNPHPLENQEKISDKVCNDVDWDNMFDTEIFSEVAIANAELVLKQMESPVQNKSNVQFPLEMAKKSDKTMPNETKHKKSAKDNKPKSKRKNQEITDAIPKKIKKVEKTNNSFRKQRYTKVVKNWLNDVDPNNPVEKDEIINNASERNENTDQYTMTVDKAIKKANKKVVQAQLANKNGIMKFGKPKTENTVNEEPDGNKTDEPVKTPDEKTIIKLKTPKENKGEKENNKEKKNKPKFVAPIKSQIPVRDVQFTVITVDENNILDHKETLQNIESKELVIVLYYSNGFSQLNNQYTEDTCDPEGFIISTGDNFLYFKGDQKSIDIFPSLLEKNKIICYDGKTLLIYLKSKFDLDIYNIDITDAKIGGSLLDPDHPPENFSELQKLLSFTPQYTIATECALQKTAWYATLLRECASKLTSLLVEEQLWNVFEKIEMKLLPIIAEMEILGVSVDMQKLKSMEDILLSKMKSRELECHQAAGRSFQINSPAQIRALIYDELKLDAKCNVKIRETLAKGAKSTSESMLRSLVTEHPLPRLILEYRHLHKAHATFLAGIAQHVKDGVVRPTWVQTAAATGRIASNNPNLQAIPKAPFSLVLFPETQADSDMASQTVSMRSVYTARPGYILLAADFQHVECRVFAHAAADAGLLAVLRAPGDFFRVLAHQWLGKPVEAVSDADRERTKRIVYASLYGAGVRKLMDILSVGYDQALSVVASFNRTFPSLKSFGRSVVSACARSGGRLATLGGRARRLRNIASSDAGLRAQAERQAVNYIVQGSAADLCKSAMVSAQAQLRARPPLRARLLLQMHDELVWELREGDLAEAAVIIKQAMESCGHQSGMANLPVSLSVGKNWGEMSHYTADQ